MVEANAARELGSFRAKFFLAFGSIGWGVKDAGITGLLLLFYTQIVGLPAGLVSFAIGTALVFDAVIDPIIGIASDNWQSRWGRRLPFMYTAAFPVGLLYFILWQPPHWSTEALFFYLLLVAVSVRGFIALFEIPSAALVPELTSDYTKRTEFLNWRWFLGILGAAFIGIFSFLYLLVPDNTHPIGQLNPAGYPKYATVASTIMTLSILISCLGLHRYIPHLITTTPRYVTVSQFARETWQTLRVKPFRILVISGLFTSTVVGLNGAMGTILLTYFWRLNNRQVALFAAVGLIGALAAFGLFVPVAKYFEKKTGAIVSAVISIAVGSGPYAIALFGWRPDIAHFPALLYLLLGGFVVFSALAITAAVLSGSMMADVVEHAALETGRRSEGTFFAAISLINKAVSGVGIFLAGQILSWSEFPAHANPAALDPFVLHRLFAIYVPIGVLLHVGAILSFSRYRITRKGHEENLRKLREESPSLVPVPDAADPQVLGGELTMDAGKSQIPSLSQPGP
ncbi:MAG: MFS transporter [Alphaproteobacteria bacterium]|nr:MFS transporter [Alphaproteobacteria bacterium]